MFINTAMDLPPSLSCFTAFPGLFFFLPFLSQIKQSTREPNRETADRVLHCPITQKSAKITQQQHGGQICPVWQDVTVKLSLTLYYLVKMVDVLFGAEPVLSAIMKVAQRQIEKLSALWIRSRLTITSHPRLSFSTSINTSSRQVGSAPCVKVGRTSSLVVSCVFGSSIWQS